MEYVVSGFFTFLSSSIIIFIGISQLKSKSPVSFYSGETPLKDEEISDIETWNRKHGNMMLFFGASIILCWFISIFVKSLALQLILFPGVLLLELPLLIINHNHLVNKYRVYNNK